MGKDIKRRAMSKRLAVLLASVVVVNQVTSVIPVNATGNNVNDIPSGSAVVLNDEVYTLNFDETDKGQPNWHDIQGSGQRIIENGQLKITRDTANNNFVFYDQNAPMLADGEVETEFTFDGGTSRFGVVVRPSTDGNFLFVGYNDNGKWLIESSTAWKDDIAGPTLQEGQTYKLKVRFEGKKITIWVDGEQIFSEVVELANMPTSQGYGVGFRTWYDQKTVNVNYLKAGAVGSITDEIGDKTIESIEEVNVKTEQYIRPVMPTTVAVTYDDGTKGNIPVTWDTISKDKYAEVGTFTVEGTVEGTDVKAVANITVTESSTGLVPPDVEVEELRLESQKMTAVLDNNFPRVIRYEWKSDGAVLTGTEDQLYIAEINNTPYVPTVKGKVSGDKVKYTMTFDEIDVVIKLEMSFTKDDVLRMEVTEIKEKGDFLVKTLNFPGHSLASVKDTENGQLAGVSTQGNRNDVKEEFSSVADKALGSYSKIYGMINNDQFAVTLNNNLIESGNKAIISVEQEDGYKKASIANGKWTYRESLKETAAQVKFIGQIAGVDITEENAADGTQVISQSNNSINKYMGRDFEAVYCGLGSVEDFAGKDLTGKVAIVDRGTLTFLEKAQNAGAAGAAYVICINNTSGVVPAQGENDVLNMIGISQETGEAIKANLSEDGTTTINLNLLSNSSNDVVPGDPEELPWSEIMIARDENGNGKVTWQDAAIKYRDNMEEVQGADYVRNSFSYIPFNIGSLAQMPFIKTADYIKKLSNYTDGFGQLVLHKGFQAEGHDDAKADIGGHTGIRQGGKDDLNELIEIGKDYNARIGVHLNLTEYHLDAFQFKVENLRPGFEEGWNWLDQAYWVDKRSDILSGELARRFELLEADHPDLSWIYIDVYDGVGWNSKQLANEIHSRGWMAATEFNGPLYEDVAWTHWGADPAYPNAGNSSKISRFIRNQEQDVYMSDDLLKGGKHMLASGWGTRHDLEGFYAIETFYNQTLPSKYMQHFEIMEWEDNGTEGFVKFKGGLESKRENGYNNMYQDGKLIASTAQDTINDRGIGKTTLFLPWTWEQLEDEPENKVYHWNPYGGETTWDLPTGWEGTESVKIYELSDLGRTFVEEIQVVDGKVTIDAKQNTPYVVFQEKVNEDRIDSWGEGSLISDPGFDSQSFDHWNVESTSDNMDHIKIENETVDRRKGNDVFVVEGIEKVDPTLIPQSEMTATATSSQSGEGADKAIDGNESTLWHTSYAGVTGPQNITVDLGGKYEINKVTCLPRQSGNNGKITKYELQVSTNGQDFTKVAEGDWNTSSDLKTINFDAVEATHIRLVANEYVNGFASMAELNVHKNVEIPDEEKVFGEGANISQEITDLVPGETYIASVWVKNSGNREVTLGVDCGGKETTSTIDRATTRMNTGEGLKWHGERLTRMRVEFTVPEGVTTAKLYVDIPRSEEATRVMLDDFRIWTNPQESVDTNRDGYVIYEDFENVDEGHGPFYMGQNLGTDNRTHYAEKNPEGGQYMNWVISDRFSLKTNQQAGTTGHILLTDQSTLQLEPNKTYELGFKYTNKVDNLYTVSVNSATAGTLFEEVITPGEVIGIPTDGPGYSREVKEFKYEFTTGDAVDYYLAINKGAGYDELVIDDLYIKDLSEEEVASNKRHLQIAVEMAKEITDAELENVVPAVVEEFKAALANAEAVLGNEKATQSEVDKAFDRLSEAMQMLSFVKGDKEALQSFIDKIEKLDSKEYIASTWNKLQEQLDASKAVIADPNAMEKEVMESYDKLVRSFLELRLKPSKDKLQDLINKADALDSSKYTNKSWKALENTLLLAKSVLSNDDATEEEVTNAEANLQKAIDGLILADAGNGDDNNNNGNNGNNGNGGSNGNGGNGTTTKPSKPGKLPQTGGTNALVTLLTGLTAIGGGFLFKRKNK